MASTSDQPCYTVVFESGAEYPSVQELRQALEKGSDEVKIEYHNTHNHEVGTLNAQVGERLKKATVDWLNGRVAEGLDYPAIKHLMRLDSQMLNAVRQFSS